MGTYTDEHIESCGQVYEDNQLAKYGVLFEVFLRYPQKIMKAFHSCDYRPLLPQQIQVQERLDTRGQPARERRADMAVQLRGDHYIEPMHHHTRNKSNPHFAPHVTGGMGA